VIAAASLKHGSFLWRVRFHFLFPQRDRCGLIEAKGSVSASATHISFPQRDRCGLIEAG